METEKNQQLFDAAASVKLIEGYKENKGSGITPNELRIIKHYETLLGSRPAVDAEKIKEVAYDLADFAHQLGFIRNYFDLISLIHRNARDYDNLIGLHLSLFNDKGLQNFDEMLKKGSELLNRNCDDLLSAAGEE